MSADLSVVICSLNGAAGVDRCLHALASQKDVDLQVIVVDDGSTDETSAVANEHGVTVIRHEVNRGLAAARNTGIAAATAPVERRQQPVASVSQVLWKPRQKSGFRLKSNNEKR